MFCLICFDIIVSIVYYVLSNGYDAVCQYRTIVCRLNWLLAVAIVKCIKLHSSNYYVEFIYLLLFVKEGQRICKNGKF